jgi:hypothetical protein
METAAPESPPAAHANTEPVIAASKGFAHRARYR